MRFSVQADGAGGGEQCSFQLYQGPTLIRDSGTVTVPRGIYTLYEYTLTATEADNITNYSDLRLGITTVKIKDTGDYIRCSWMELEVPDASAGVPPTLSTPTVSGIDTNSATLGATIDDDGGNAITSRGTVWGTSPAPITNLLAEGGTDVNAFSHLRSSLPAGTLVYFRGYATTTAGTGYSPDGSFYTEPVTQPSNIGFANITDTGMRITFNAGSADGRIVVVRQDSAVDTGPTDGTEHTADTVFGSGAQLGTGNYVVYRGNGTQVDITGLTATTTYHVAIYEYAGSAALINYQQDTPERGSRITGTAAVLATLITPTATAIETTTATLGATIDNDGGGTITERGTVWDTTSNPTANLLAEGGTAVEEFSHDRFSLPAGTLIYYRGYAINSAGIAYSPDGSFYTEPAGQPSNVGFENVTDNAMRITWTAGSGDGRIVVVKETTAVDSGPIDGNEHAADTVFEIGEQLGTGNYVVYRGTGTQVDITNLTAGMTYHVAIYEYAGSAAMINYQQDAPDTGNQTTTGGPSVVPILSSPNATAIEITTVTLWVTIDSNGGEAITSRGTVWDTNSNPTANQLAEGGTAIETFSHDRSSLPAGTLIYFRGYAINSIGTGYSPDGSFYTEPATQATGIGFENVADTTMRITWTQGSGDGTIVIVKQDTAVDSGPVDGTDYTANSVFQNGSQLGTGNYVVFKGSASQVDISGLTAETTYHVAMYEYAGSGSLINYQQDAPDTGSQDTAVASGPVGHNETYNVTCTDCHSAHSGGYVKRGELQSTLCKTCHNPLGVASDKSDVNNHPVDGGATIIDCGSCHEVHAVDPNVNDPHSGGQTAPNLSLFRSNTSKYVAGASEPAVFQQRPAHFAFNEASPPWSGACQTCHSSTTEHSNDSSVVHDHHISEDCTTCHAHTGGFASSGCTGCHGEAQDEGDGGPTRRAVVGEFGLSSHHVAGGAVTDDDCGVCHYESVDNAYHKNNIVDLRDPDDGTVSTLISFAQFSRNTSTDVLESWVTDVQNNFCMKCHDTDGATATAFNTALQPFSSNTRDAPNILDQFDTANTFFHPVRGDANNSFCNSTTMAAPWNQGDHDQISCFDCHAVNGHGGDNNFNLRTQITGTTDAAGILAFCTTCHKVGSYSSGNTGSDFADHSRGQHRDNAYSCRGCHAGQVDDDQDALSDNGGRFPQIMIHGGSFTWDSESETPGVATDTFMFGGWLGGLDPVTRDCFGGNCSHTTGSKNW